MEVGGVESWRIGGLEVGRPEGRLCNRPARPVMQPTGGFATAGRAGRATGVDQPGRPDEPRLG